MPKIRNVITTISRERLLDFTSPVFGFSAEFIYSVSTVLNFKMTGRPSALSGCHLHALFRLLSVDAEEALRSRRELLGLMSCAMFGREASEGLQYFLMSRSTQARSIILTSQACLFDIDPFDALAIHLGMRGGDSRVVLARQLEPTYNHLGMRGGDSRAVLVRQLEPTYNLNESPTTESLEDNSSSGTTESLEDNSSSGSSSMPDLRAGENDFSTRDLFIDVWVETDTSAVLYFGSINIPIRQGSIRMNREFDYDDDDDDEETVQLIREDDDDDDDAETMHQFAFREDGDGDDDAEFGKDGGVDGDDDDEETVQFGEGDDEDDGEMLLT
jgi:hypothetical protein